MSSGWSDLRGWSLGLAESMRRGWPSIVIRVIAATGAAVVVALMGDLSHGLFTGVFLAILFFEVDYRIPLAIGLVWLLTTALFRVFGYESGAEAVASATYGFLVVGVLGAVVSLWRTGRSGPVEDEWG